MTKRVLILSGKRGGYGALRPLCQLFENDPLFTLTLLLTDQHLNQFFGATKEEVEKDFTYTSIDMRQDGPSPKSRVLALGRLLSESSSYLSELNPDVVVLYGDRGEVLTFALACVHLNIPIAHIQGGDTTGNVDDHIRHAITCLSKFHFPSCSSSYEKILDLGATASDCLIGGDTHLDEIYSQYNFDVSLARSVAGLPAFYILYLAHSS